MRHALDIGRVRAVRTVLRAYPQVRGRIRLSSLLLGGSLNGPFPGPAKTIVPAIPEGAVTRCRHGMKLRLHRDAAFIWPYLFGEYEEANTRIYRRLVFPGAIAFDVGASYGWYSALLAKVVGESGKVHAFEPLEEIARLAADTISLNGVGSIVKLNTVALSREAGGYVMYTFRELPLGHASSSDLGRTDAVSHDCRSTTLDEYVAQHRIEAIDFLKVDVEGHERDVFLGARSILGARNAPVVSFEINHDCLAARRLTPAQVQEPLVALGYDHFWVIDPAGMIRPVAEPLQVVGTADYLAAKADGVARVEEASSNGR